MNTIRPVFAKMFKWSTAVLLAIVGLLLALSVLGTAVLIFGGGLGKSEEADGFFRLFLLGDLVIGIVFLLLYKARKKR
ncbi:MAG: hypothetical protein U0T73_12485 [Chitinophagales bacterium]